MPRKTRETKNRKAAGPEERPGTPRSAKETAPVPVKSAGFKDWLLKNKYAIILGFIVAAGAFLRLYKLDFNSIWLDEAATAQFSEKSFARRYFTGSSISC